MCHKPDYLIKAEQAYRQLADEMKFLCSIRPVPEADVEDVELELRQATIRLQHTRTAYKTTPAACEACRTALEASGDDMICPICHRYYEPLYNYDPIPF